MCKQIITIIYDRFTRTSISCRALVLNLIGKLLREIPRCLFSFFSVGKKLLTRLLAVLVEGDWNVNGVLKAVHV